MGSSSSFEERPGREAFEFGESSKRSWVADVLEIRAFLASLLYEFLFMLFGGYRRRTGDALSCDGLRGIGDQRLADIASSSLYF